MSRQMVYNERVVGKTQANGAFEMDSDESVFEHQITVNITGSPTAGTIQLAGRTAGSSNYVNITGTIDMVAGPLMAGFQGTYDSIRVTPAAFDGTSYDVTLAGI